MIYFNIKFTYKETVHNKCILLVVQIKADYEIIIYNERKIKVELLMIDERRIHCFVTAATSAVQWHSATESVHRRQERTVHGFLVQRSENQQEAEEGHKRVTSDEINQIPLYGKIIDKIYRFIDIINEIEMWLFT